MSASKVNVRIRGTFELVSEWDRDNYDVSVESIILEARENPDDWAIGSLVDEGTLSDFTVEIVT